MPVGGTISFGGLASGLDTKNIVEKLTDLKKTQLINPLEDAIASNKDRIDAFTPITTALSDLKLKSRVLNFSDNAAWNVKTGISSDTDKIIISAITPSTASTGTYEISNVSQLAQPDRIYFNGVADTTSSQFGTGTLSFTYKGVNTSVVINDSNNTLAGIKNAINDADFGVVASIINDGDATTPYRLLLTSVDSGADTAITEDIAAVLTLTKDAVTSASAVNEPQDALFELNGLAISSASNSVSSAIQGLTFNLLSINTTSTTTITIKQDNDKITKSITDFVESFANLKKLLRKTTQVDPETNKFGILGRELIVSQAFNNINLLFSKRFTSLSTADYQSFSQIGITTDVNGNLQIDSSKLNTALENNLSDVQTLFQGNTSEDGVAEELYNYTDSLINSAGIIPKKIDSINRALKRIDSQLVERQRILETYELTLFNKFNKLEQTLALLQQQQQSIESFAGIYSGSSNKLL